VIRDGRGGSPHYGIGETGEQAIERLTALLTLLADWAEQTLAA
jgi:hypothetical protein